MNKKLTAVVLSGAVVWLMGAHALAAQPAGQSDIIPISAPVEDIAMTDSALLLRNRVRHLHGGGRNHFPLDYGV